MGADGSAVRLADGMAWLLATPRYRAAGRTLTMPRVDRPLDQLFERTVFDEATPIETIWEAARALLLANYDLADDELADLLSVAPGDESRELALAGLDALYGPADGSKTYCDWVRASLLANGLGEVEIPTRDLPNVLAILVSTHRTIPVARFVEACRVAEEREDLESLV